MAGAGHNDRGSSGPQTVPPFWIRAEEGGVRIVDERVVVIAEKNWHWAFRQVKRRLNETDCTPEIVEHVAIEVTNRLRADPDGVGRNLLGYFRTAVIRRIQTLAVRGRRVAYEGGAHDLETNHQPTAPDWTKVCEDRVTLELLLPYVSHPVRRMMNYRVMDYSWKHIARAFGITERQAQKRFHYGISRAYDALRADQARRPRGEESD
jgi:DNA-directed RNA polymerase specialized sigma24 family protein